MNVPLYCLLVAVKVRRTSLGFTQGRRHLGRHPKNATGVKQLAAVTRHGMRGAGAKSVARYIAGVLEVVKALG